MSQVIQPVLSAPHEETARDKRFIEYLSKPEPMVDSDFTVMPEEPMTDEQIFEMMKASPEFEHLPKPASWFKRFGLEPVKARNFKEYLEDDAYMEARGKVITEKVIYNEPQPGGVRPVLPPEIIPMEIISRPLQPEAALEGANVLLEGSAVTPQ